MPAMNPGTSVLRPWAPAVAVDAPEDLKMIHAEETAWRAQPQVAADGKRVLFSSFHGRQWHQLWLTTVDGAALRTLRTTPQRRPRCHRPCVETFNPGFRGIVCVIKSFGHRSPLGWW